jgi:hypothetical protein
MSDLTHDDIIIRLAKEAGMNTVYTVIEKHEDGTQTVIDYRPFLARFAALVAAAEREACAKIAESYEPRCDICPSGVSTAIRARGEQK